MSDDRGIDKHERLVPCRDRVVPYGDDEAILSAFLEDGYVVVSNVIPPSLVEAALDEIWTSENLLGRFDRRDPETRGDPSWPQREGGGRNFPSSRDPFLDSCNWDVASSPRQFRLQKLLWGREDLITSGTGRWGVMRPSGRSARWRTESDWLHWDHNPWTKPGFSHVQAIVCLTDSTPTAGGFACVPGFHKRFQKWGEDRPMGSVTVGGRVIDETFGDGQPFPVPADDPIRGEMVQTLAPAGSMILWDSRLPHQNVPNIDSDAFRVVFYCNMIVATASALEERRRLLAQRCVLMDLLDQPGRRFPRSLTPLGERLHGWRIESTGWTGSMVPLNNLLAEFGIDNKREDFLQAVRLVREAALAEEEGDIPASIWNHRAALRAFPGIEEWHNVIFG